MKKAQAAMEFLMTYGWALLVVLLAIGAISWAVTSVFRSPSTCDFGAGLACIDKPEAQDNGGAGTDTVTFAVRNGFAFKINITGVSSSDTGDGCGTGPYDGTDLTVDFRTPAATTQLLTRPATVEDGQLAVITITCEKDLQEGDRLSMDIVIGYYNFNSQLNQKSGGKIQRLVT